jgi:type IV fimbrial biogenesis protein FimT
VQNYWVKNPPSLFFCLASKRQSGFTLVELLVALAVAAILLAVGVPSFRTTILSNRLTSATNDMVGTLAQARSEAIKRGERVTVCMSANGTQCATTGTWEQGWISFIDTTRSGTTAVVDTGETLLSVTQRDPNTTVIRGSTVVEQYISFSSDGTARRMSGASQTGVLRICEPSGALTNDKRARDIDIASVGRLSTTTPASVAATCPTP